MVGWWCVRHGDSLAWVQARSAPAAIRRSLDLHALGDWTDDGRELVVFPRMRTPGMRGPTTTRTPSCERNPRRAAAAADPARVFRSLASPPSSPSDSPPAPRPRRGAASRNRRDGESVAERHYDVPQTNEDRRVKGRAPIPRRRQPLHRRYRTTLSEFQARTNAGRVETMRRRPASQLPSLPDSQP